MSNPPKNHLVFTDVPSSNNQVDTHFINDPDPNVVDANQQLLDLVDELRAKHLNKTDSEIFKILLDNFKMMYQDNSQNWHHWQEILSIIFVGGVEATKIFIPTSGIPIEVTKRLYEIYQHNSQEISSNVAEKKHSKTVQTRRNSRR